MDSIKNHKKRGDFKITIKADSRELTPLFEEMKSYREKHPRLFKKAFNIFLNSSNCFKKAIRINSDGSAARADEMIMRFEPTDLFRMFCLALRTGKINDFILKHEVSL